MTSHEFGTNDPYQYAQEVLRSSREALKAAVVAVSPESPDADPLVVFPSPQEVRAEDAGLDLTAEQQAQLRAAAAELGFGRQTDRTASELGLAGAHVIIEGGQPHKMLAEAQVVVEDKASSPTTLIFSASPHREVKNLAEIASAERLFGQAGKTEYEVARQVAESLPNFTKLDEDRVLPYGYDIDSDYALVQEATGQFVHIGQIGKTPVILMRIDRESYTDEQGAAKYRKQPDTAATIGIVDAVSGAEGDNALPIAFVTSATYQASRQVDGARASLVTGRVVGVPTYGTERLATIKGEAMPAPAPINQLPGELHKMAEQVAKLEQVLAAE